MHRLLMRAAKATGLTSTGVDTMAGENAVGLTMAGIDIVLSRGPNKPKWIVQETFTITNLVTKKENTETRIVDEFDAENMHAAISAAIGLAVQRRIDGAIMDLL